MGIHLYIYENEKKPKIKIFGLTVCLKKPKIAQIGQFCPKKKCSVWSFWAEMGLEIQQI